MIMVLAAGVCMAYGGAEVRAGRRKCSIRFFPDSASDAAQCLSSAAGISEAGLVFGEYQRLWGSF